LESDANVCRTDEYTGVRRGQFRRFGGRGEHAPGFGTDKYTGVRRGQFRRFGGRGEHAPGFERFNREMSMQFSLGHNVSRARGSETEGACTDPALSQAFSDSRRHFSRCGAQEAGQNSQQ
jgi:hypothetical protein